MWTEEKLNNLVPWAVAGLRAMKRNPDKTLLSPQYSPDPDTPNGVWTMWSVGVRAYAVLFWLAYTRRMYDALGPICSETQRVEFIRVVEDRLLSRRKELTRITQTLDQTLIAASLLRQKKGGTKNSHRVGYTRDDVPAEADRDGQPILGSLPGHRDERTPPPPPPGPARTVSVEEYLATRRTKQYGGVSLEFDKESTHFAKERKETADKYYDGTPVDQLIGQTE